MALRWEAVQVTSHGGTDFYEPQAGQLFAGDGGLSP